MRKHIHIGNYTILFQLSGITIMNIAKGYISFGYMNIRFCWYKWKTRNIVYYRKRGLI